MNPSATRKLTPADATGRVYQGIYRAMIERRLMPGAWLREEEVAQTFGVSRTVVRQALQRLAQDHLIDLQHNRGARVAQPSLREAEHVFEARRVVECEIARRVGGTLDDTQLAELQRLVQAEADADRAGDTGASVRLSGEFHLALARLHGNPLFCRMLESLLPTTSLLMASFKVSGGPVCTVHRHAELLRAMASSGAAAAAEMRRHLKELEQALTGVDGRQPPLRDVFAPYRERVDAAAATAAAPSDAAALPVPSRPPRAPRAATRRRPAAAAPDR